MILWGKTFLSFFDFQLFYTAKTFCLYLFSFSVNLRSVPDTYADRMVDEGILTRDDVNRITKEQFDYFNQELQSAESYTPEKSYFDNQWKGFVQAPKDLTTWDTGMTWDILSYLGNASVYHPTDFVRTALKNSRKAQLGKLIKISFFSSTFILKLINLL